jgi:hypothetical protein
VTLSPTKQGFSPPSTSRVKRVTTCHQPPPTSSTETTLALAQTRLSTGTGAGKRILLSFYELSRQAQQDNSNGPSPLLQLFGPIPIEGGTQRIAATGSLAKFRKSD